MTETAIAWMLRKYLTLPPRARSSITVAPNRVIPARVAAARPQAERSGAEQASGAKRNEQTSLRGALPEGVCDVRVYEGSRVLVIFPARAGLTDAYAPAMQLALAAPEFFARQRAARSPYPLPLSGRGADVRE